MFNIFHPHDPIAYRLEPLLLERLQGEGKGDGEVEGEGEGGKREGVMGNMCEEGGRVGEVRSERGEEKRSEDEVGQKVGKASKKPKEISGEGGGEAEGGMCRAEGLTSPPRGSREKPIDLCGDSLAEGEGWQGKRSIGEGSKRIEGEEWAGEKNLWGETRDSAEKSGEEREGGEMLGERLEGEGEWGEGSGEEEREVPSLAADNRDAEADGLEVRRG